MATFAKRTFDVNAQRASYFIELHHSVHGGKHGAPVLPVRELPRAAVVFAVGALDTYLTELSAEVLVSQIQHRTSDELRDVLRRVEKDVPGIALEIALLSNGQARLARAHDVIVQYFHEKVSQHGAKAVASTLQRLGGNPAKLWSALGARQDPLPNAAADLEAWTLQRHAIVHRGETVRVHRNQALTCIGLIGAIAEEMDQLCEALK